MAISPNACNADAIEDIEILSYGLAYVPDAAGGAELINETTQMTLNNGPFTPPSVDSVASNPFTGDATNLINPNAAIKSFSSSGNSAVLGTTSINTTGELNDIQALNKNLGITTMNLSSATDMGNMSSNNVDLSKQSNLTDIGSNTVDYSKTNEFESGGSVGGAVSTTVDTTLDTNVHAL